MARVPVHRDLTNLRPRLVVDVGSAGTASQADHLASGADQPRNQEAADVSAAANYHDTHGHDLARLAFVAGASARLTCQPGRMTNAMITTTSPDQPIGTSRKPAHERGRPWRAGRFGYGRSDFDT